jgi:hypothetical protein
LKSGKAVAYSQDDLLKVERDVADSVVAATGLPVFVAWNLSREQVGPSAGKIADVEPTARQKGGSARKGRNHLKISVPATVSCEHFGFDVPPPPWGRARD